MSNGASVSVVNGPTDLTPDELAERKRISAAAYHLRELDALRATLAKLERKQAEDPSAALDRKVANQNQMIADAEAALATAKES